MGKLFIPGDNYYSETPLPTSADLKCRSHSKTNKKTHQNVQTFGNPFFFSAVIFVWLGFVWFCLNGQKNRDVAGVKVNQTRRQKSNIVFMDQGTCISFSKRYIFTIPFFISQYIAHLCYQIGGSPCPLGVFALKYIQVPSLTMLVNLITIFFQVFLV